VNILEKMLPQLKSLRLSGILDTLDVRNKQAIEQKLSYVDFLSLVLNDEHERRENKKLAQRLRRASFQGERTIENFRFDEPDLEVNTSQIFDLATCAFIEEHVNVLIVGPTGVGKSHIAQAIGHAACRRGFDVQFVSCYKMLAQLRAARADGTYERKLHSLLRSDLLILDDFGLRPLTPPADDDFHELVTERYERGSIMLTSNLDLEEWGSVFPNPVLATAAIDRLRHMAHRVIMDGPSGRPLRPLPGEERRPTRSPKK
jgi:DNA replication protein DnaC